jgi:hypothetical protein
MSKCDTCLVHVAASVLHGVASAVAGKACPRKGRVRSPSAAAKDWLREAVVEYEEAVEDSLGLKFGWREG